MPVDLSHHKRLMPGHVTQQGLSAALFGSDLFGRAELGHEIFQRWPEGSVLHGIRAPRVSPCLPHISNTLWPRTLRNSR